MVYESGLTQILITLGHTILISGESEGGPSGVSGCSLFTIINDNLIIQNSNSDYISQAKYVFPDHSK